MNQKLTKNIFRTIIATTLMVSTTINASPLSVSGILNLNSEDFKIEDTKILNSNKIMLYLDGEVAEGINGTIRTRVVAESENPINIDQLYITFDNFFDTLTGDLFSGAEALNFSTSIGKKAIRFGREGHLLGTETQFIDKSLVSQRTTGTAYSTGEGIEFNGNLPTPVPVNLNLAVVEDVINITDDSSSIETGRPLVAGQVNVDLPFGDYQVDLGIDSIYGSDDKNFIIGLDLGLTYMDTYSLFLDFSHNDVNDEKDMYYAATLSYDINQTYGIAFRYTGTKYDSSGNLSPEDEDIISILATKKVSDRLKMQLQYNKNNIKDNLGNEIKDNIQAQLVFNIK